MTHGSLIGSQLAGRFEVVDLLGEGATGEVYLARHGGLGREFAVKVLKAEFQHDHEIVERFRREARAASRFDHPNIVYISDFGQTADGRFYLVMEYTPGRSLRDELDAAVPDPIPLPRALLILEQIAAALGAAHDAGVIHRDLKPENVFLSPGRPGTELVKVLDFGLAKIMVGVDADALTRRGQIFGTPAYMSPEQAMGDPVDGRADIYSLGIIAFELCTGRLPFECETVRQYLVAQCETPPPAPSACRPVSAPPLPPEIEQLILQCLEKNPDRRPTRGDDLSRLFRRSAEQLQPAAAADRVPPVGLVAEATSCGPAPTAPPTEDMAAVAATLPGDLAPPDEIQDFDPERQWLWDRICKKSQEIAKHLLFVRLGTPEMTELLKRLSQREEAILAEETELALLNDQYDSTSGQYREREANLRYAVVDLSLERTRLADSGAGDQPGAADLDFQITQLEQSLLTLYQEQASALQQIESDIQHKRSSLATLSRGHIDLQLRLLNLVRNSRSQVGEPSLLDKMNELDDLATRMG